MFHPLSVLVICSPYRYAFIASWNYMHAGRSTSGHIFINEKSNDRIYESGFTVNTSLNILL